MIHGIDWGGYDYNLPAQALYTAGVRFAIIKGGQPGTIKLLKSFRDSGMAVGCYYWNDPILPPQVQINYFVNLIHNEQPDFISLDIEQYWQDWLEWEAWINQGIPMTHFLTGEQISSNARAVRDGLKANFPEKFYLNYTAKWFTDRWSPELTSWIFEDPGWYASAFDYGQEWYEIQWADILNTPGSAKPDIPAGAPGWAMWQYSSRMVPPGLWFPLDWNVFDGYIEELLGKEVTNMAGIYKTTVPLEDRAWVIEYKADEKLTIPPAQMGVDAVILPMVNMPWDGSHTRVLVEPTFTGRFMEMGSTPVFGKVVIDAGIVTTEQHTQPELDGQNVWQNLVVPKILDAWHIGPWTPDTLKPADFRPIQALIFEQTSEMDHQSPARDISPFWQNYFFRYVLDHLRVLVQAGAIPNVPLILKSNPAWLQKYPVYTGCADWLYLDISQPRMDSTSVYPDLWSIFQFATWNDFKYSFTPDGYAERVLLFEFSAGKQHLGFMTGNNLAYLSKAFDNAAGLTAFLNAAPPIPPTDPCADLQTRLAEVEQQLALANSLLDAWQAWYGSAPRGGIS